MADTKNQNQRFTGRTDLSCPATDVPYRTINSNRKTGPPRQTSYEVHTMALKTKLASPRITRKGDTSPHVTPPTLTMVTGGKQRASRSTITPIKTCSANIYRCIKRRVGRSVKRAYCRGTWSLPESKLHINYLELKAVFLALKGFQELYSDKTVLVASDNTTVVAHINKEGGMRLGHLCALLWRILTWCTSARNQVTLKAQHIPC